MLLGHKRLANSKYYKILSIRKDVDLGLYGDGVVDIDLIIKTTNSSYTKTLQINVNTPSLKFINYDNVGSFVYTSDTYYIYVYFKPTYGDRIIYAYSKNDNIIAYFENDITEYNIEDLTDNTEVTDYVPISGSGYLIAGITGNWKITTLPNDIIVFNMNIVIADDLTASNKTLLQNLNLPNKTFIMFASTLDGTIFGVQYSNGKFIIPSTSGDITAGTYRVNGVVL